MGQTQSLTQDELEEAFEMFSRVSVELDATYRGLQARVADLTEELSSARTARLRELAEKERLANRLSSLVSALPGGVLIVDRQQRIRDANPEALQVLGAPLIGELWEDVLRRSSGSASLKSTQLQLRNGKRYSVVSRVLDDLGDQVLLITDVTEVHQLQAQLGRKQRLTALGEMAARLAHQVRTPLSAATLYMAQLSAGEVAPEQRQRIALKVSQRLDHMGKLLDSMLSFVRGGTRSRRVIYLNDILADFNSTVLPQLADRGATLEVPVIDNTLRVLGDRDELVGALCNLAMNALEAAGDGVAMEVWVGALSDHWLQIRVRDNGPGISEEIRDRIFDPFFTTRASGTGLGLAVVAMTVSDHGGEITAHNHPGGGAEFLINLPIAAEASVAGESSANCREARS
ncbi:MAG: PAS domain-containing protein [Halioglobus sp.]|nr:PAS domain-containing protein [Halioglobus sp.]